MDYFLHFIVNKQSRNSDTTFKKLLLEIPKYTHRYEISVTESIEQLDELLYQFKEQNNNKVIIVMVGGDGSLNQLVTLFEKYELKNYIGYIPSGSGNDFARANHIPVNTEKAIAHLFNITEKQELSIIHATEGDTEHFAVNSLGIGLDGLVNHFVNSGLRKKYLGATSYLTGVISGFLKQKKFKLTLKVDDGVYHFDHVQLALIANNPFFGGGINILPPANGKDDYLDILIADNVSAWDLFLILPRVLFKQTHLSHPKLHSFTTKEVALYTETEQYGQKDGEQFNQEGFAYTVNVRKRAFWI